MAASRRAISPASSAQTLRSETIFPACGCGGARPSSQVLPQVPKMSVQVTGMPSLAKMAWTWSLQLVRMRTSLCRYAVARIMPMPGRAAWVPAGSGVRTSA